MNSNKSSIMKQFFQKVKAICIAFRTKRVFYTIYFNYKYLPRHQAKHLPIIFYKHAYATISNGGKIILTDEMVMNKKKVKIGYPTFDFEYQCEKTHLSINSGTLYANGSLNFRRGCIVEIRGVASFGDKVRFAPRCRLRIHNAISCGSDVAFSHETQVFDTNFHYMEPEDCPGFYPISKKITIGSCCWISNRCTVMPGAVLPDKVIVASNSLVNKDFSSLLSNSLIGGVPAKLIKERYARVWDTNREQEYHRREFSWYK